MISACLHAHGEDTLLIVRVTPKSSKDSIEGIEQDDAGRACLKVRVRAVPEGGAANKAVCQLIAKAIGLSKTAVSLHAGDTSRLKQLLLPLSTDAADKALMSYLGDKSSGA